jgi:nucleotide-binding universal stress UspA family protein
MFERILTATDMLNACDAAVVNALEIAKQNQGRLFVMHVLEPTYFNECGPLESVKDFKTGKEIGASPEYFKAVHEELDKKCAGVLKPYGNYEINIAYGKPSIEIRRWARKIEADLIVLGPHAGKEEEKELIGLPIGNTVEDVIMHVTTPVMIVNRFIPKERLNFKKIMVCIDFSKSCAYACELAIKLARRLGSKLYLFHMLALPETEREIKEKLVEFCKMPEGIEHEYSIWEGKLPYSGILKYESEKGVDLIVMGSHTREKGERWYVGSAVEQVSANSFCPVTVITHPDALLKVKGIK